MAREAQDLARRPRCERYPCGRSGPNRIVIEHERPRTYAALGEIEDLYLCDRHALETWIDARGRLGGTVHAIELSGPAVVLLPSPTRTRAGARRCWQWIPTTGKICALGIGHAGHHRGIKARAYAGPIHDGRPQ
jgi:hypothetical protein